MSKFIKLSNRIINPAHLVEIQSVLKKNNVPAYHIYLNKHNYSGWWAIALGSLDNSEKPIEICSKEDFNDYHVIKRWILQNMFN